MPEEERLRIEQPFYTILQMLSVSLFEKTPILQAFQAWDYQAELPQGHNQLSLLDQRWDSSGAEA